MNYSSYDSPIGNIILAADEIGLSGLWFEGEKNCPKNIPHDIGGENVSPVLGLARQWLDEYFNGDAPEVGFPLHPVGTEFQLSVWDILKSIPYGSTLTYGEIAREIAEKRGIKRMSAQAVGNAVGKNPVSIIIPCHRVMGADGSLTGYAGGIDKKRYLLELEGIL